PKEPRCKDWVGLDHNKDRLNTMIKVFVLGLRLALALIFVLRLVYSMFDLITAVWHYQNLLQKRTRL
ncbi:unnamed protein product, partial [Cuscuta campestris]